MLNKNRVFLTW